MKSWRVSSSGPCAAPDFTVARLPRFVLVGQPHLVSQRGHNGQPIVTDDADRRTLLALLREAAITYRVELHAWVLLDGQLQFLATPRADQALSRLMQTLGRRYVAHFNQRHGRTGTLFDGRFRLALLQAERWLVDAMRCIEQRPSTAGLTNDATTFEWSSCSHHLGRGNDPLVTDAAAFWALGNTPFEREAAWRRLVETPLAPGKAAALDAAVRRGCPLGTPEFFSGLKGEDTQRSLTPRRRGRPRQSTSA